MNKYFLIITFLILTVRAGSQYPIPSEERMREADMIVIGEITGSFSFWDIQHRNIYTCHKIKVINALKGEGSDELEVMTIGGIVENIRQSVSTSPSLGTGEIGLFILKKPDPEDGISVDLRNRYILLGGEEGFYEISDLNDNISNFKPAYENEILELVKILQSGINVQETINNFSTKGSSAEHIITGIAPDTITAGTGSVLNISGEGFGSVQGEGEVRFVNADRPDYIFSSDDFEIRSWTDTLIQLVVPHNAGTGNVFVTIGGENVSSPEILFIRYSYSNLVNKPYILINSDQAGGYTWRYATNLNSNNIAANIVSRAIDKWICATSVPWQTGEPVEAIAGMDGICSISFGTVADGLGVTSIFAEGIVNNSVVTAWVVKEIDIVLRDDVDWCYDRANILPAQYDFETAVLHELGHAHLLGHVNNAMDLMHSGIAAQSIREINSSNDECGTFILNGCLAFSNPNYRTIILSGKYQVGKAGTITGNPVICQAQGPVTFTVPLLENATSYIWSLPEGASGTSSTNSIIVDFGPDAVSGNITVRGTNSCNTGEPSVLAVVINSVPRPAGEIAGPTNVCREQTAVNYTVPVIENAASYVWTLPEGASGTSSTNSITVSFGQEALPGEITVQGINSCGAGETSSLSITINSSPAIPLPISGNQVVCQGQNSVVYTVPPVERADSYTWTLPSGATGTSVTNSITVNYGTNALSGEITVSGINTCGSSVLSSLEITVLSKPPAPTITLTDNILHSNAPAGNQWYVENTIIAGATDQDHTVTYTGDYYAIVTITGCSSDASNVIYAASSGHEFDDAKIYPNPVAEELIIELPGNYERLNFEIINAAGQIVIKGFVTEKAVISTIGLTPGMYLVKFGSEEVFDIRKIVKE